MAPLFHRAAIKIAFSFSFNLPAYVVITTKLAVIGCSRLARKSVCVDQKKNQNGKQLFINSSDIVEQYLWMNSWNWMSGRNDSRPMSKNLMLDMMTMTTMFVDWNGLTAWMSNIFRL